MQIRYTDQDGEGFFDSALGAARRAALEFAVDRWASTLAGSVPVIIDASMDSLGGTGTSATLASTGSVTSHRAFPGGQVRTWYSASLANQLSGQDLNGPELAEIRATFNSDVDNSATLGSIGWYYGTDATPGQDIDFVSLALHEIGHGLNFSSLIAPSGEWLLNNDPGIFDRFLFRPGIGLLLDMEPSERLAAIVSGHLLWVGANLIAFQGEAARLYAPDPFEPGASVAHWDVSLEPEELMEPFYMGPNHDLGLLLPALVDMGWELAVASPTPRASPATPTRTRTRRPTVTPAPTSPFASREWVYVTNFDDGSVSVIDPRSNSVVTTLAVGAGPIGLDVSTDGRHLYVANFHAGSLSVIDTVRARVAATMEVGTSANQVAATGDGLVVITDTASDAVMLVDPARQELVASFGVGRQPSGVAVDLRRNFAFVADFGENTISVIDLEVGAVRAKIVVRYVSGFLGIALASPDGFGYATAFRDQVLVRLDTATLGQTGRFQILIMPDTRMEAIAIHPDRHQAYVATFNATTGAGQVQVVDTETNELETIITVGSVPEALALSDDGKLLYVANAGDDTVSVVDVQRQRVTATIPVGHAPMGIVSALIPGFCEGDCNGDGKVTVDELLLGVNRALGSGAGERCEAADIDGDGAITVSELMRAVGRALGGCGRE